ncbi:sulfotransferase family 2 domain-containing protein [Echinicola sp. CAU 1574]|uniref:Sulfotransferase family 2 domain-containing protein n=1 Tax=Echinicola arenosa TaxID=2774144 RepID=A0ABR9ANS1_9BACT|nr:sulfotransferase family 2 domain-containing protein [Echinicola arenosa]MBD8490433.1 sulfotransferase family 2 domain-containing protein [Echinicola arenosa]
MKLLGKLRRGKEFQNLKSKIIFQLRRLQYCRRKFFKKEKDKSIYLFNHIPKCGGTSLKKILNRWFYIISDYPPHDLTYPDPKEHGKALTAFINKRPNYLSQMPWEITIGHYHKPEFNVFERFPNWREIKNVKMITFIRDPLEHRISHYYFGIRKGHSYLKGTNLKEYILNRELNFISKSLGCTIGNYREVLDSYYFIGTVEEFEKSIFELSMMLNRKIPKGIPHSNRTEKNIKKEDLPEDFVQDFKEKNWLDYLIYDYVCELRSLKN